MARDPFDDGRGRVLSQSQVDYLTSWVRKSADELGLRDWTFRVSPYSAEADAVASSFVRDQADESVIAVSPGFLRDDAVDQRQTLTHELLHPHFQRVTRLAEKLIETELGKRTEAVIAAAVGELEEQVINRLATAVARFMPTVEMPKGEPGSEASAPSGTVVS